TAGIFKKFGFSVKKFLVSFFQEYNSISGKETDDKGITIWVNWGRDQAQVLNSLIKSDFTLKTGINVNVQMVNASVVQAVLSGKGPDCLLQQSRSEPVNLAMRGMLYNLKDFDDCDEVLKNFQSGAELPYYYKGGLYALPDTQSFYLMFYRRDILEEMDLPMPNTWEEFNDVAKIITRNNLTVWLPNNTATSTAQANIGIGSINLFPTLLVQKGLKVYTDDGRSTNLSDPSVIKVFREWTDLYSKLKLPRTMDFYNRFRTGTCPLGVNTYSLYTTLKAAAPEIDGLWSVAFVPGSVDENGKINHASTGGGAACCILDMPTTNAEYAWQFLKWWVSSDTQLAYSSEVESILGPTGRITVSNVEAFKSLEWDPEMEEVIVQAMLQAEEIPEYPGSYYVSRSVYQAFWNVVENNQNAKQTLLKFAAEADDEIARKWKQYENR
ncbi:MAG: extracellular solute-binding protein, partial [Clostridia bacterium]|nr:extracellular solute-binding protein [Clostridia bacterium]